MDYFSLGLKVGLEIHRQLDTRKLFCRCPSVLREEEPDTKVKRFLRPVAGELGKIDVAALHEQMKKKFYLYEAFSDTTCLVELDESPPEQINQEALDIVLMVALQLNSKIADEIQVMRKTVLDGSNTSGFQRTALVATGGRIETPAGKIGIQTVSIEEDSARIMKTAADHIVYRLDRLGIPLVEIATAPDIRSPQDARVVAETIGNLIRATGKVKTGIGTIRQDLNLSIKGGARVEIKGVQDLSLIPAVIEKEVERQLAIVKEGKRVEPEVRKANEDGSTSYMRPMPGEARMYPETDLPYISIDPKRLAALKKILPEAPEKTRRRLLEMGLGKELANQILNSDYLPWFDRLAKKYKKVDAGDIAALFVNVLPDLRSREKAKTENITIEHADQVVALLQSKKIAKEAVPIVLKELAKNPRQTALQVLSSLGIERVGEEDARRIIRDIIERERTDKLNVVIGLAMEKLRGKIDGAKIAELSRKELKKRELSPA